jgi:hypothetical protein
MPIDYPSLKKGNQLPIPGLLNPQTMELTLEIAYHIIVLPAQNLCLGVGDPPPEVMQVKSLINLSRAYRYMIELLAP